MTDLAKQEQSPVDAYRSELAHQGFEIATREQLHDVVERPIGRHAEIEQLNRVRRGQCGRRLRFTLEPAEHVLRLGLAAGTEEGRTNELDGGVARQEPMARSPHFT